MNRFEDWCEEEVFPGVLVCFVLGTLYPPTRYRRCCCSGWPYSPSNHSPFISHVSSPSILLWHCNCFWRTGSHAPWCPSAQVPIALWETTQLPSCVFTSDLFPLLTKETGDHHSSASFKSIWNLLLCIHSTNVFKHETLWWALGMQRLDKGTVPASEEFVFSR